MVAAWQVACVCEKEIHACTYVCMQSMSWYITCDFAHAYEHESPVSRHAL